MLWLQHPTHALSPPPLDGRVAQAEPYYSLNPGLFDSVEHWKYRDLQKLAKTLENAQAQLEQQARDD